MKLNLMFLALLLLVISFCVAHYKPSLKIPRDLRVHTVW